MKLEMGQRAAAEEKEEAGRRGERWGEHWGARGQRVARSSARCVGPEC